MLSGSSSRQAALSFGSLSLGVKEKNNAATRCNQNEIPNFYIK
jgi:hypothetical protein